jgi:hypothetical protein
LSAGYAQIAHADFAIVVEVVDKVDSCFYSFIEMNECASMKTRLVAMEQQNRQ